MRPRQIFSKRAALHSEAGAAAIEFGLFLPFLLLLLTGAVERCTRPTALAAGCARLTSNAHDADPSRTACFSSSSSFCRVSPAFGHEPGR